MKIGLKIKELRIKKGMTQEELAEKTELSARTIQRIENGEVDPRAYTLQMIAKALEVDFSLFTECESDLDKETKIENDKNWLGLIHLSGLFCLFFPTVIIWNRKKHEVKGITDHFRDVINFQLTNWFLYILPGLFIYLIIKLPFLFYLGLILSGSFTIINTLKVLNGKPYKYLTLIKLIDKKVRQN